MKERPAAAPQIDARLLDRLLESDAAVSAYALSLELGLSNKQLQRELDRLAAAGCELDRRPHEGVRLARCGLGVWVDYLRWKMPGSGQRIVEVYSQTGSTQDAARRLAEHHGQSADGAVVLADHQTAGRGRLGRRWHAPAGTCVLMSRVCCGKADHTHLSADRLVFATSVALAEALEAMAGSASVKVMIRWPNDLLVDDRKIGGILVEAFRLGPKLMAAVVGVGINVTLRPDMMPDDEPGLAQTVTSLAMHGCELPRVAVAARCIAAIDHAVREDDVAAMLDSWRARSVLLGRRVRLRHDERQIVGDVVDLDPRDGLIVRMEGGELVHLPADRTTLVQGKGRRA